MDFPSHLTNLTAWKNETNTLPMLRKSGLARSRDWVPVFSGLNIVVELSMVEPNKYITLCQPCSSLGFSSFLLFKFG